MLKEFNRQKIKAMSHPLCLLGIFCYFYTLWFYNFAEMNVQIPFLDFPIFIGEIFLGFFLLILFMQFKTLPIKLQRSHYFILAYFAFVLGKAFYGYSKCGPLAFRNAALFYYPLFALFAYYFYKRDLLKNKFLQLAVLSILLTTVFFRSGYKTFYFTYVILILLLFLTLIKSKVWRWFSVALFIIICYHNILITFYGGRAILASSFFSYLFLFIITTCYFFDMKLIYKKIVLTTIVIVLPLIIWNTTYKTAIVSLATRWTDLRSAYEARLDEVGLIYQKDFEFADPPVKVYEENKNNPFKFRSRTKPKLEPELITVSEGLSKEKMMVNLRGRSKEDLVEFILTNMLQPIIQADKEEAVRSSLQSKNKEELIAIIVKNKLKVVTKPKKIVKGRNLTVLQQNILYRWYMWQEIFEDLFREKKIIGFDFGKPFRSKNIQLLRFDEGWKTRVGWLTPHNSYVHMLYRSGVVGSVFILTILGLFIRMVLIFIRVKSIKGILLSTAILYWLIIANFMVILELPYFAIPFWCLFGMTLRYCNIQRAATNHK